MGSKNWSGGDVVNAADFNAFLANQVVMVFADATARDAGFGGSGEPTLAEGMVCYLSDTNGLQIYDGAAWVTVADTDVMVVDSANSRVGIGTASPTNKLTVDGGITVGSTSGTWEAGVLGYTSAGWGFSHRPPVAGTTAAHGFAAFDGTTKMVVTESGDVGIGNSAPTSRLHVTDSTDITPDGNSVGHIQISGNGYAGCFALDATGFWMSQNSASRSIILATNETERLRIDGVGRAFLNSTSADFGGVAGYLNVKGSTTARVIQAYVPTSTASANAFLVYSDVGGANTLRCQVQADGDLFNTNGTYGTLSDERLKTVEPARGYLADLLKLKVVNYQLVKNFRPDQITVVDDDGNESTEAHPTEGTFEDRDSADYSPKLLGLVAQQVEPHIPGLIKTDEYGVKSIRQSVLVPMLLQAVQTLTARIETLEAP